MIFVTDKLHRRSVTDRNVCLNLSIKAVKIEKLENQNVE